MRNMILFSRRRPFFATGVLCLLALLVASCALSSEPWRWTKASPESQGMSSAKLEAMRVVLEQRGTRTLLVIRNDRIVFEWYARGYSRTTKHYTASLAKALVGGMSLLVALNDGRIAVDDPAEKYVRQWRGDKTRRGITVRHLATHSSGIEDAEVAGMSHYEPGGWKTAFWKREPDPFTIARDWAPLLFEPGKSFAYSNPGMAMLGYAVTASLRGAPQKDIKSLLRERIMKPIGMPDNEWSMGYGRAYEVDGLQLYATWGGGGYSPNAVARVGRLMLRKGDWEGRRLVDAGWVEKMVADAGTPVPFRGKPEGPSPKASLCWWVNSDGVLKNFPRDAFMGAGNQVLLVVPSLNLIVVRNGEQLMKDSFWGGLEKYLFNPLMDAIAEK